MQNTNVQALTLESDEITEIKNFILESKLEIYDSFQEEFEEQIVVHFICNNICIAYYTRDKKISVGFLASLFPPYTSELTFKLMKLKCIESWFLPGCFYYKENGDFITGDEAISVFQEDIREMIIKDYLEIERVKNSQVGKEC